MAGLEAPWLVMVSSPEMEERRRKERRSGGRCCLRGGRKGQTPWGWSCTTRGTWSLLDPCMSSYCCLHEVEEGREERENNRRKGRKKRKGEKIGKFSKLGYFRKEK
jgi:hypothetical protein